MDEKLKDKRNCIVNDRRWTSERRGKYAMQYTRSERRLTTRRDGKVRRSEQETKLAD